MDTEAGSSRKSETVKRQTAACTRPEERKIEWGFEAESIWCLECLWHSGRAGNQSFNEGLGQVFKAWPGFRWRERERESKEQNKWMFS